MHTTAALHVKAPRSGANIAGPRRRGTADFPPVTSEIAHRIALLDDGSTNLAEEAKVALIRIGDTVLQPLADAVPGLGVFGELSAIEVFEELRDPTPGPALICLLGSPAPLAASLLAPVDDDDPPWPSAGLADVIGDLADHGQAVLYFQLWRLTGGRFHWTGHDRLDDPLDLTLPWAKVVEVTREKALLEAAFVAPRPDLVATVEWIDRSGL